MEVVDNWLALLVKYAYDMYNTCMYLFKKKTKLVYHTKLLWKKYMPFITTSIKHVLSIFVLYLYTKVVNLSWLNFKTLITY